MNCLEAREAVLDAFAELLTLEQRVALERHVAVCPDCATFVEEQRLLDRRLTAALPLPRLSATFRTSLRERIRCEPTWSWPDFLPDVAHVIGCVVGVAALALVLPQYSGLVIPAGAAFGGLTFFLQALLRSSVEGGA